MSDRTWQVIVTAGVGLALLVVLRIVLGIVFERVVNRAAKRKSPDHAARLRTRLTVLRRVILAFVFVVVLWSVLEIFPATEQIARTLLASSAFVALVLGVAFSVPLGNIGAGILLSLSQPVRIGDRITVGDVTGTAEEITLVHTIVKTDQGLTAFVPNSQMVTSTVINRSLDDPRRLVSVRLPVAITAPVERARECCSRRRRGRRADLEDASVAVIDVAERTTWLSVTGYAPRPDGRGPRRGRASGAGAAGAGGRGAAFRSSDTGVMRRVRFAPSPTGSLHVGNALTAAANRAFGDWLLLRIDDTDPSRTVEHGEREIVRDLEWLGIAWDEGPARQSERQDRYRAAVERLGSDRFGRITLLRPDGTATYHLASVVDDIDYEITHVVRGNDHRPNEQLHRELTEALGARAAGVRAPRPRARPGRRQALEARRDVVRRRPP